MCRTTADVRWSSRNLTAATAGIVREMERLTRSLDDAPVDVHAAAADLTRQAISPRACGGCSTASRPNCTTRLLHE